MPRKAMDSQRESERYRIAAEEALDQIYWCVRYLERIRKPGIADVLARNCETIRRQMRGGRDEHPRPRS